MKKKGLVFIFVAITFGLIAFLGVFSLSSKMTPTVPVLTANTDIVSGTPLDRSMFYEEKIPEAGMPDGLMATDTDFSSLIASKDIITGDFLREPAVYSLNDPNPSLFSARLRSLNNPSLRGMEVPVESIRGVLSGMNTQDYVDLISVSDMHNEAQNIIVTNPGEEGEGEVVGTNNVDSAQPPSAKTIIRGAPVIGVRTEDGHSMYLIVAVTEEESEEIALHQEIGKIYATLRPFGGGSVE